MDFFLNERQDLIKNVELKIENVGQVFNLLTKYLE